MSEEKVQLKADQEPEAPETTEVADSESEIDWAGLVADDDVVDEGGQVEEPAPEPQAEAPESEPEPAAEPEAAAPEPEPEPVAEAPPVPEPEPPAPEPSVETTGSDKPAKESNVEDLWTQRQDALLKAYAMTEEQGSAVLSSPEQELPRMMAQMQVNIERFLTQYANQMMPAAVHQLLEQRQSVQKQNDAFFTAWPKLGELAKKSRQGADQIARMRQMYRQVNPQMPEQQLIQEVGAALMISNKIPFEDSPPPPQQNAPPARPASPRQASAPPPRLGQLEQFAADLIAEEEGRTVSD